MVTRGESRKIAQKVQKVGIENTLHQINGLNQFETESKSVAKGTARKESEKKLYQIQTASKNVDADQPYPGPDTESILRFYVSVPFANSGDVVTFQLNDGFKISSKQSIEGFELLNTEHSITVPDWFDKNLACRNRAAHASTLLVEIARKRYHKRYDDKLGKIAWVFTDYCINANVIKVEVRRRCPPVMTKKTPDLYPLVDWKNVYTVTSKGTKHLKYAPSFQKLVDAICADKRMWGLGIGSGLPDSFLAKKEFDNKNITMQKTTPEVTNVPINWNDPSEGWRAAAPAAALAAAPAAAPGPPPRPTMPTQEALGLPENVYIAQSYHPMTSVELDKLRHKLGACTWLSIIPPYIGLGPNRRCNSFTYENDVVNPIINAAIGAGFMACTSPSMCWKLNVIAELNVQYYDLGIRIDTHPWTENTSWAQVAHAAEKLEVDICAGMEGETRRVVDRMDLYNLMAKRELQEKILSLYKTRALEWDEKYADVFESAEPVSWVERDLALRKNAVDISED